TRRGWVTITRWSGAISSASARNCGARVVLPVPGGACTTAAPNSASALSRAVRPAEKGRLGVRLVDMLPIKLAHDRARLGWVPRQRSHRAEQWSAFAVELRCRA